ncbi:hypothetical protein VPNG_08598 [Cytospora leucostoma]|uniref:1,3-beta-glucanosyltransferase n=1 Tax=Cytospora leucostoma TaxID=1230097 RepID=A0A423W4C6_9PEZI|nr:hypothetical protein VPNG_08598 [Cytospora leucostoma]
MKSFAVTSVLLAAAVSANPTPTEEQQPNKRASLPTVTASGNAFWAGKNRFYVRGLDYQPGGSSGMSDPLADEDGCKRDISEFKTLGVNTSVFATIDEFVQYDNTLAFFSGNEVVNDQTNTTLAAPYVKATTRDMRQYISKRGYRKIPVGYSAADVSQNRWQLAQYFNCGSDDERSDFFAFNDYSWCNTNYKESGWDQKVKNFTGYGIPLFLSEYGCITNGRDFGEVAALMSDEMTSVYSGGLVYEYSEESSHYGLVSVDGDKVSTKSDFLAYSTALASNPAPSGDGGFTKTTNSAACPSANSDWLVSDTSLPAIPTGAVKYMSKGAGSGPGLTGDGSQNAGGAGGPAPLDRGAFLVTGVAFLFTLVGTLLL